MVDVDEPLAADSTVAISAPADTERISLRPYPKQCYASGRGPECDIVAFVTRSTSGNAFFFNGMAGAWHATVVLDDDARRGLLYVPAGSGASIRDSVGVFVDVATMTEVRCGSRCSTAGVGARLRLHAVVPTSDALRPGTSLVYQPRRAGDGVLHVRPGEPVTVAVPGGQRLRVIAGSRSEPAAPEPADPWAVTDARAYTLGVRDSQMISVEVPFHLVNRSGVTLYIQGACTGFAFLERWSGHEWQTAFAFGCLDGNGTPASIPPGATVNGAVHVVHSPIRPSWPGFMVEPIPGVYRIAFALFRSSLQEGGRAALSDPLTPGLAVSNTFSIAAP